MSRIPTQPLLFHTVAEVAAQLKVSQKQVRRWIAAGMLPTHRFGRLQRIAESDLRAFAATCRTA